MTAGLLLLLVSLYALTRAIGAARARRDATVSERWLAEQAAGEDAAGFADPPPAGRRDRRPVDSSASDAYRRPWGDR